MKSYPVPRVWSGGVAAIGLVSAVYAGFACAPAPPRPEGPAAAVTAPSSASPGTTLDASGVARAVARFDESVAKSGGDPRAPGSKGLLDEIAAPLAAACAGGSLDPRTRSRVVKLLSDSRDPRGGPCLIRVLEGYRPGENEEDIRVVADAAGAMKLTAAGPALLEVFATMRPSQPKAAIMAREVHDAVLALVDTTWEPRLLTLVARPMAADLRGEERKDEAFWQITAAEALGMLRSEKAVTPLIDAVRSLDKPEVAPAALTALIQIGKPAIAPAVALLRASGPDTKAPAGAGAQPPRPAVALLSSREAGALILGTMGRGEAAPHLIEALGSTDDYERSAFAREIVKLPSTPATVKAFQSACDRAPLVFSHGDEGRVRAALISFAPQLFDASLTPWIVSGAMAAKGAAGDVEALRGASLVAAMKLMTAEQAGTVEKLARVRVGTTKGKPVTLGQGFERDYRVAKELVTGCAARVDCYLDSLADPLSQSLETQFRGVKAATMVGVLGGAGDAIRLVDRIPALHNTAVRVAALLALDHLCPQGNPEVVRRLEALIVDAGPNAGGALALKVTRYRLLARAQ